MVEAAGRLDRDHRGSERREAGGEFLDAGAVAGDGEGLLGRKHVNVELVLRDVDADDDGVHPVPSLSKRARMRPRRLFGFDGTTDADPRSPTGSITPGAFGPAPATAPARIADPAIRDLQEVTPLPAEPARQAPSVPRPVPLTPAPLPPGEGFRRES